MSFKSSSDAIFDREDRVAPLGLIVMNGAEELGEKIDQYLVQWSSQGGGTEKTFRVEAECPRFATGDGKGIIKSTVRGTDLFILVDVGNYNCQYNLFGYENRMSPDDHYQDLKRLIQAAGGKAHRINVIMPILYGGRQHRRNYRESLDCAVMLQEMRAMGVSNLVTFDAHDPRVQNAVPLMGLDNMMPTYQVMKCLFHHYPDLVFHKDHFMIVSPDEGAINRNMYYASMLSVNLGMFYKRRDYSRIVNGRNPIVAHEYLGDSVEGKDIFIADDIISSGESMLDIAYELKKRKAKRIFVSATFALFTGGLSEFDKAYQEEVIAGVFGTNLTYLKPELRSRKWFHEVDMAKYIAYYVASLNHDMSVGLIIDPHKKIDKLLQGWDSQK
jgi:ribose-phosphate pyrophosphokinase